MSNRRTRYLVLTQLMLIYSLILISVDVENLSSSFPRYYVIKLNCYSTYGLFKLKLLLTISEINDRNGSGIFHKPSLPEITIYYTSIQ